MDTTVPTQLKVLTTRSRMKVLGALSGSPANRTDGEENQTKRLRLHSKVVGELKASERSYVNHLNLIVDFFMRPLQEKEIISTKEFNVMFGQIESICRVNYELLNQLDSNDKSIGHAFVELAPYLKIYCSYANCFEEGMIMLQNLEKDRKEFATFMNNQESRPEVGMKLNSLLITPIQRIPRYKLLLEELLQYTLPEEADYKLLKDALKEISLVANLVNNCMHEHENMQKMLTIQRSLSGGQPKIVVPGRTFIKEGPLMKISRNRAKTHHRIFFLFNDMLMYCKQRGADYETPNSLSCCCILPIKHCVVESLFECGRKQGSLIKVTCKNETLLLLTDDAAVGDTWVEALRATAKRYSEYRQTLRKESSAKRPLRRTAILKQKEESLSKLNKKRKLEAVQDETDDRSCQGSIKDSLFPMREIQKVQDCIGTPKKRPRFESLVDGVCSTSTSKGKRNKLESRNKESPNNLSIIQEDSMSESGLEGRTIFEEVSLSESISTPNNVELGLMSSADCVQNEHIANTFKKRFLHSSCVIL